MSSAIHRKLTVRPGGRIELTDTDLPSGTSVDVFVIVSSNEENRSVPSAIDILHRSPGNRLFHNADEVDDHLRDERDSWEA